MAIINQIRGMLLEEVLLYLLRNSGYRTIENANNDPTLKNGPAGIKVKGRGCDHQIDAIADFIVNQPFSNPQRLLVEAKCYVSGKKIGVQVARNALGVLKDVSEYWIPGKRQLPSRQRYHYQYALFSSTPYTNQTEQYAFAHDIYLIPFANSAFMQPIIFLINDIVHSDFGVESNDSIPLEIKRLRESVRNQLKNGINVNSEFQETFPNFNRKIHELIQTVSRLRYAIIAVLGGGFPIFLVPNEGVQIDSLPSSLDVRIRWNDSSWYIYKANTEERMFSFDLPLGLFRLYEKGGKLTQSAALNLKEQAMSQFYSVLFKENEFKIISFRLDENWLRDIQSQLPSNPDVPLLE